MEHINRLVLFAAVLVTAAFFALNSIGELPDKVATYFSTNGTANRWTNQPRGLSSLYCIVLDNLAFTTCLANGRASAAY